LDGNGGDEAGCGTPACGSSILTIGRNAYVDITGVDFMDGSTPGFGGAIANDDGGTLLVSGCSFTGDRAGYGGAISNGGDEGTGRLIVTGSTFYNDEAEYGGAIANAQGGGGTASVTGSIFGHDSAVGGGAGGAVVNGDGNLFDSGSGFAANDGALAVTTSQFLYDSASAGGAIASGYQGFGTLAVTGSTFSSNDATYGAGGAIDDGDQGGTGTASVTSSTFLGNSGGEGGAIGAGDFGSGAALRVSSSTFVGNVGGSGGAIGILGQSGNPKVNSLVVYASSLVGNTASDGTAIDAEVANGDDQEPVAVWTAADVISGTCQAKTGEGGGWHDEGYEAVSSKTCSKGGTGDVYYGPALDGLLTPVSSNGGPTETVLWAGGPATGRRVPPATSVVLDGSVADLCPSDDQRGDASAPGRYCYPGSVQGQALYAYASGSIVAGARGCAPGTSAAKQCTLSEALSQASGGDVVELASGAGGGPYVGNWSVPATGNAPLLVRAAPGTRGAVLSGGGGASGSCSTATCDGPVITVPQGSDVALNSLTIDDADNTATGDGGGVSVGAGSSVSISQVTFAGDVAQDGGAIDSADGAAAAAGARVEATSVHVSASTFVGDLAADGGAIDNADHGGEGVLTVTGSSFSSVPGGGVGNSGGPGPLGPGSSLANGLNGGDGALWAAADVFAAECSQGGGAWRDQGYNVGAEGSCLFDGPGDVVGANLPSLWQVGAPGASGGATLALQPGSPAVRAVPLGTAVAMGSTVQQLCPTTDETGLTTAPGTACNAGASGANTWFAYTGGQAPATSLACPLTATVGMQCSLSLALGLAAAGDSVELATPGATAHYVGNWPVSAEGGSPLTLEPAAGVTAPVLDGNRGLLSGCQTAACDGAVIALTGTASTLSVRGIGIEDADNTANGYGGAISNDSGAGFLKVTDCSFRADSAATAGGAIADGPQDGELALSVTGSTFEDDNAGTQGGALDVNRDFRGAEVSASNFTSNSSKYGGAVDVGATGLGGVLTLSGAVFSDNHAVDGGAVYNQSSLTVASSRFSGNVASRDGGAIDTGETAEYSWLVITSSALTSNRAGLDGGAIDNADHGTLGEDDDADWYQLGYGTLDLSRSVLSGNTAMKDGGGIDNGDNSGSGTMSVTGTEVDGNYAARDGGAIDNGDHDALVWGPTVTCEDCSTTTSFSGADILASTLAEDRAGSDGGALDSGDNVDGYVKGLGEIASLYVRSSTLSGDTAARGGAVDNGDHGVAGTASALTLIASTVAGDRAATASAVNDPAAPKSRHRATSWVAADILDGTCQLSPLTWVDGGYNVGERPSCLDGGPRDVAFRAGLSKLLGPLATNGGPTKTVLPLPGNPALALVPYGTRFRQADVQLCPTVDQRGTHSSAGHACNAGAVQNE
jgi:hypothetical protein